MGEVVFEWDGAGGWREGVSGSQGTGITKSRSARADPLSGLVLRAHHTVKTASDTQFQDTCLIFHGEGSPNLRVLQVAVHTPCFSHFPDLGIPLLLPGGSG